MNIRKLAAAAGFACGAALAFAPLASADISGDAASGIDGLLSGLSPADATSAFPNLAMSFDGINLLEGTTTTATTTQGQFDLAIAYGAGATAYAGGGYGDTATAIGTNAVAEAGSKAANAATFNFDSATDIGNNAGGAYTLSPDGAFAGGASLIGGTDATTASGNDTAQWIGNGSANTAATEAHAYGNSGAFAGDSGLIGDGSVGGNGDTAYTSGNITGFGDGASAGAGNNDYAYVTGTETGSNEGALAGFGNFNFATADNSFTQDGSLVTAGFGTGNYALTDGPVNSVAGAGGNALVAGNGNIAEVVDPFNDASTTPDSAFAGSTATAGNYDLAEVLLTHGAATAGGANYLYDIISLLGNYSSETAGAGTSSLADILSSLGLGSLSGLL